MPIQHIDVIDMNFVRMAQDWARARQLNQGSAELRFPALKHRLAQVRIETGLPPAERSIAVLSRDFDNRGQDALKRAVEAAQFSVAEVDYRHTYITRGDEPARIAGSRSSEPVNTDRSPQTLTHWLAYMCGMVAVASAPSVVVFSAAFELAGPLTDLVARSGGRAVLVYFQRMLNKRWFDNGLLEGRMSIEFSDLERHAVELLGADLRELARQNEAAQRPPTLPL